MIYQGSCDTEYRSNDAENSALQQGISFCYNMIIIIIIIILLLLLYNIIIIIIII